MIYVNFTIHEIITEKEPSITWIDISPISCSARDCQTSGGWCCYTCNTEFGG